MGDYNGWTNWETWHTKLLIDNDQSLYNISQSLSKRKASISEFKTKLARAEKETKQFFKNNQADGMWKDDKWEQVNWKEIRDVSVRDYEE